MSDIDVIIYKVIKHPLGDTSFFIYEVESEHFTDVRYLLDFGREIKYNSQFSSSENIFIDDREGAYEYAYIKNYEQLKDISTYMNTANSAAVTTENSFSTEVDDEVHRDICDFNNYPWKLVRLTGSGIIKLCRRRSGETVEYKDSVFITELEKDDFVHSAEYDDLHFSNIKNTDITSYSFWSSFIDEAYKDYKNAKN